MSSICRLLPSIFAVRPFFERPGNPFNASTIAGTLLLFSIVYAVLRYEQEKNRHQVRLNQELRNAQELSN